MVLTPTKQIPLGFSAPDFELLNPFVGETQSLINLQSTKATLIVFMCNHCPYVIHILDGLIALAEDYSTQGVSVIAINSNDTLNYPDDSPEKMIDLVMDYNIPFPYLFDSTQNVAKAYNAECTPDFSVFDGAMKCIYRGQMDDSRPGNNIPVTGHDIRLVLDNVLLGNKIEISQKPSVGCNIKWK